MNLDEIDANNFVDARASEIQNIEKKIQQTTKKSQLFQRLPFHKRRRTKSRDTRKTPNKHKRIKLRNNKIFEHPFLATHKWFAKRFEMINFCGSKLPFKRRQKSDKFIYKSKERGFIFDDSYRQIFLYKLSELDKIIFDKNYFFENDFNIKCESFVEYVNKIELNLIYKTRLIYNDKTFVFDILKTEQFFLVIHLPDDDLKNIFINMSGIKLEICFNLFFGPNLINDSGIYNEFKLVNTKIDDYIFKNFFEKKEDCNFYLPYLFIKSKCEFEKGKLFVQRKDAMKIWQMFFNKGFIPMSINELLRLGLENNKLIYPFDFVNTEYYKEFELNNFLPIKEKFERTPASKKVNYEKLGIKNPFFIPDDYIAKKICYFTAEKGNIKRMAHVYENNNLVGYVIRGSFSFQNGKCKGVLVVNDNLSDYYSCKNINEILSYSVVIDQTSQINL
ncbi:Ribonucleases P/MRP protein subunit pop1 [Gurleya vavrai]